MSTDRLAAITIPSTPPCKPPKPPLCRFLCEDNSCGFCPECGSSLLRKIPFFGKKKCANPLCGFEM